MESAAKLPHEGSELSDESNDPGGKGQSYSRGVPPSEKVIPFIPSPVNGSGDEDHEPSEGSWADTLTAITLVANTVRATEEQAAQLEARTEKLVGIALEQIKTADNRIVSFEMRLSEALASQRTAEARANEAESRASEADARSTSAEARAAEAEARQRDAEARTRQAVEKQSDAEARAAEAERRAHDAAARQHDAEMRAAEADRAAELSRDRHEAAEARAQEAEQWRERIHEAVAANFPMAFAGLQNARANPRGGQKAKSSPK